MDDAGRRVKLIQNYADGDPNSDEGLTTVWTYTTDGQIATLTAKNSDTGDQVTRYVYGTTLSDAEIARSDLLRAKIYPDSDDTSDPLGDGPDGVYDRVEYNYNRQGQRTELKDQNETVHVFQYDRLGRLVEDRVVVLGTGVDGAVRRIGTTYEVRGLPDKVTSHDNPAGRIHFNRLLGSSATRYNGGHAERPVRNNAITRSAVQLNLVSIFYAARSRATVLEDGSSCAESGRHRNLYVSLGTRKKTDAKYNGTVLCFGRSHSAPESYRFWANVRWEHSHL